MTWRGFDAGRIRDLAGESRACGESARGLHGRLATVLTDAEARLDGAPATTHPQLEKLVGTAGDAWWEGVLLVPTDPTDLPGSLHGELADTADEMERRVAQLEGCRELVEQGYTIDPAVVFAGEDPPDAEAIDDAVEALGALAEVGSEGNREDLRELQERLDGLTDAELDAVITAVPEPDLRCADLVGADFEFMGMESGLPYPERREHFSGILARVTPANVKKLRGAWLEVEPSILDSSAAERGEVSHWAVPPAPLFGEGISGDDVTQGRLGDCWFLASLAAMAETNPPFVREGIRENANGTLSVRIWDEVGNAQWVTVTRDLPVREDGSPISAMGTDSSWAAYYEKAFSMVYGDDESGLPAGSYGAIEGDYEEQAPPYLTGSTATELEGYDAVRETFESGRPVVADTPSDGEPSSDWQGSYATNHAYYVEGIAENGDLMIGNPWGPERDLRVTPDEFEQYFETPRALNLPGVNTRMRPRDTSLTTAAGTVLLLATLLACGSAGTPPADAGPECDGQTRTPARTCCSEVPSTCLAVALSSTTRPARTASTVRPSSSPDASPATSARTRPGRSTPTTSSPWPATPTPSPRSAPTAWCSSPPTTSPTP
ncbi:C2 family cysteine protease [Streptomyces sp. B6B3]|uniref:C2 family cysteine protease n=1 Tax=Streptomyces sp. B6B3 TaxID=3153570 RepID=UPI00325F668C